MRGERLESRQRARLVPGHARVPDDLFAREYGWAEIETPVPGLSIGLGQVEDVGGQGAITPTFRVVDIDAARRHLEGSGVRFDGETSEVPGMVRLATFYDPDGNPWMLAQVLQETQAG